MTNYKKFKKQILKLLTDERIDDLPVDSPLAVLANGEIKYCSEISDCDICIFSDNKNISCLIMFIEWLMKNEAVEINRIDKKANYNYRCPCCKGFIRPYKRIQYCENCGEKLTWN